jgi:hypothetical protein
MELIVGIDESPIKVVKNERVLYTGKLKSPHSALGIMLTLFHYTPRRRLGGEKL